MSISNTDEHQETDETRYNQSPQQSTYQNDMVQAEHSNGKKSI